MQDNHQDSQLDNEQLLLRPTLLFPVDTEVIDTDKDDSQSDCGRRLTVPRPADWSLPTTRSFGESLQRLTGLTCSTASTGERTCPHLTPATATCGQVLCWSDGSWGGPPTKARKLSACQSSLRQRSGLTPCAACAPRSAFCAALTSLKVRPNLLSIYAVAVTLLLLLWANNSMANNQATPQPDEARSASLEEKLKQSQARMLALESKLISTVEAVITAQTSQIEAASVKPATPPTHTSPPLPPVAVNQLPLLPVTQLPPPPFFQTRPKALPQPATPSVDPKALVPLPEPPVTAIAAAPLLPSDSVASSKTELKPDVQSQWLGQTDTVYDSLAFEEQSEHTQINMVGLALLNKELDNSSMMAVAPMADSPSPAEISLINLINLDLQARRESELDSVTESKALSDDGDLAQYLTSVSPNRTVGQKLETATMAQLDAEKSAESEVVDVEQNMAIRTPADPLGRSVEASDSFAIAKLDDNLAVKSNSLFSDEELTRRLNSTPLLDDWVVAQKLATAPTIAQLDARNRVEQQIDEVDLNSTVAIDKTEATGSDLLAKSDEPTLQSRSLFKKENLARYLSSTPLLDDEIIARRLGRTSKEVRSKSTEEANNVSPLPTGKIYAINLSLLDKVEAEQSGSNDSLFNEDLAQYLTAKP